MIDGWIFNAPSYQKQAELILNMYLKYKNDLPYYLNGQFNIFVILLVLKLKKY